MELEQLSKVLRDAIIALLAICLSSGCTEVKTIDQELGDYFVKVDSALAAKNNLDSEISVYFSGVRGGKSGEKLEAIVTKLEEFKSRTQADRDKFKALVPPEPAQEHQRIVLAQFEDTLKMLGLMRSAMEMASELNGLADKPPDDSEAKARRLELGEKLQDLTLDFEKTLKSLRQGADYAKDEAHRLKRTYGV